MCYLPRRKFKNIFFPKLPSWSIFFLVWKRGGHLENRDIIYTIFSQWWWIQNFCAIWNITTHELTTMFSTWNWWTAEMFARKTYIFVNGERKIFWKSADLQNFSVWFSSKIFYTCRFFISFLFIIWNEAVWREKGVKVLKGNIYFFSRWERKKCVACK